MELHIKVFGVTALTSLTDDDTNIIYQRDAASQVNAMLDIAEFKLVSMVLFVLHMN